MDYLYIAHIVSLILIALWMTATSIAIFMRQEFVIKTIERLGYPKYFPFILGTAKLIGVCFLLLPLPTIFKTIVFVGVTIEVLCATISYFVIDRKFSQWGKPLLLLIIIWTAFVLWRLNNNIGLLN
ncbi:DoxX family protein [Persicitalea sp.]|uniref:DoxX family protein n=1 Tax=Persicitalea sp. TaxID=3100273 RepID=UPI0035944D77